MKTKINVPLIITKVRLLIINDLKMIVLLFRFQLHQEHHQYLNYAEKDVRRQLFRIDTRILTLIDVLFDSQVLRLILEFCEYNNFDRLNN